MTLTAPFTRFTYQLMITSTWNGNDDAFVNCKGIEEAKKATFNKPVNKIVNLEFGKAVMYVPLETFISRIRQFEVRERSDGWDNGRYYVVRSSSFPEFPFIHNMMAPEPDPFSQPEEEFNLHTEEFKPPPAVMKEKPTGDLPPGWVWQPIKRFYHKEHRPCAKSIIKGARKQDFLPPFEGAGGEPTHIWAKKLGYWEWVPISELKGVVPNSRIDMFHAAIRAMDWESPFRRKEAGADLEEVMVSCQK